MLLPDLRQRILKLMFYPAKLRFRLTVLHCAFPVELQGFLYDPYKIVVRLFKRLGINSAGLSADAPQH